MKIEKIIEMLCDGDNNKYRDKVNIKAVAKWYATITQKKKAKPLDK